MLVPPSAEAETASYDAYQNTMNDENKIKTYVFEKSLNRPHTNLLTIVLIVLFYLIISFLLSHITIWIFKLEKWHALTYLLWYFLCFVMIAKFLAIKSIECYQHYAKVTTRRKCLCMPTCSEYAIAVLKKYPILIAIIKIRKRLFKTCKGDFYKIDFP